MTGNNGSSSPSVCTTRPLLKIGSQDSDSIRQLQEMLNNIAGSNLTVDGVFGKDTRTAVQDFKRENGLAANAVVGQKAWDALCEKYSGPEDNTENPDSSGGPDVCSTKPNLRCGSTDSASIRQLQEMLNKYGGQSLSVDGVFGPYTEQGVKNYQTNNRLIIDGIVGNQTWTSLCGKCDGSGSGGESGTPDVCSTKPNLRCGSTDSVSIRQLQEMLNRYGGQSLSVDGVFGPYTEQGVKNYQTNNRLIIDGIVGNQTWTSLCGKCDGSGSGGESGTPDVCSTKPNLRCGSTDSVSIRQLQEMLNRYGGQSLSVDGVFGPYTEQGVKNYQTNNRLIIDGIVGNQTWTSLCGKCDGSGSGGESGTPDVCSTKPNLRCGSTDSVSIRQLQEMLNRYGGQSLSVDGVFGPYTEQGVKNYQTNNRLIIDGIVGNQTWTSLCGKCDGSGSGGESGTPDVCSTKPNLRCGSTDSASIRQLQEMLNRYGGQSLSVDGVFGPYTEQGVKNYQTNNRLIIDGIVGNQTWTSLCSKC